MTAVIFVTIFIIVVAFLVRRSRRRRRWRHARPLLPVPQTWPTALERFRPGALEQARRQITEATERAEHAARLHRAAETSAHQHIQAKATLTARLEATCSRIAALEAALTARTVALDEATAHIVALDAELTELRAADTGAAGWDLLLARVERQWADAVNAGADERGVMDAPLNDQLTQAVRRDLERLREEVGVNATLASSPMADDGDPLTTLLAVSEAAALLATHSEHVIVDLRDSAVVFGQDWTGDDSARRRLDRLAAMATTAGLKATVEVVDNAAHVALDLRPVAKPPAPPARPT